MELKPIAKNNNYSFKDLLIVPYGIETLNDSKLYNRR